MAASVIYFHKLYTFFSMSFVLYVIDFIETELSKLSNIFETMFK